MPQKTVYGTATKENVNVAAVKLRTDNCIPLDIPDDILGKLEKVRKTFDDLGPTYEGVNLSNIYYKLKEALDYLHYNGGELLNSKVEYRGDKGINTLGSLIDALYDKVHDPYVSEPDETIPDLFSILYGAIMGPKEDS